MGKYCGAAQATDCGKIWRMRIAFRIGTAYCFCIITLVTGTRLNVTFIRTLFVLCYSKVHICGADRLQLQATGFINKEGWR